MTGYQRVLAALRGEPVDSLPLMPITMMFAADQIGVPYGKYAADHRVMVEAQIRTAREVRFRLRVVHFRSRPRGRRLRGNDPLFRRPAPGRR